MSRAVYCFNNQTYPNKELVVVDDGSEDLEQVLQEVPSEQLVYEKLEPSDSNTLGKLRNITLKKANGMFLAQWDDDDWYHPDRLKIQAATLMNGNDACCLSGALMHLDTEPYMQHPYVGYLPDGIPGSIMHRNDSSIEYPHTRRAEDTVYLSKWMKKRYLQLPGKYSYLFLRAYHGSNTWEKEHFLRRVRNTPKDFIQYVWYAKFKGKFFKHPKFQLTEKEKQSFEMFLEDSAKLGLI
jgi:glycosyltransferase involved in cell wall biosynthesis